MDSASLNNNLKRVYIDKELCKLIKCVKNVALITTWGEVIDGLREYITQKQLFDFNRMKVFCPNDDLEQLFGVSEFEILDIKDLLKRLVFPIRGAKDSPEVPTSIPTVSDASLKRKNDEVSDVIKPKKTFECASAETSRTFTGECSFLQPDTSPMILHIPTSPAIDSGSDSVDSIQCYETSVVKDTSDESVIFGNEEADRTRTEYFPEGIITVAETFELEYEPLSEGSSEDMSACDSDDSESDLDFIGSLNSIITFVSKADSDLEYLADMSSDEVGGSDSSLSYGYDAEISEEDLWKCSRCSSINNPPNRFCSKCFSTRQGWLANEKTPERRKRRKPRSKRKKCKNKKDPSLSANSKSLGLPCTSKESVREDDCENSKFMSSQSTNESSENKLCLLCCSKPVNSSIIHGKFAHSFSCFGCAKRLQMRKRRCPICRRTIERVVYQISA